MFTNLSDDAVSLPPVALIGYGRMGRPMGRRLLAAGHHLIVYDLEARARQKAEDDGADVALSPAEATAVAEVIITMLPNPQATTEASYGADGILSGLQPGTLWIEMSSSHPATTLELAQAAAGQQASLLDAPVTGGVGGASEGTLTILVGGTEPLFQRAKPILELLGTNVFHVGDRPGDGDLAKTINNLLSTINLTAAAEALALGIRGGLDPNRLLEAISTGSGSSKALTTKIPSFVLSGTYDAGFTISQMLKDLRIGQEVATGLDVPLFVGSLVHAMWTSFAADGHGEEDHTAAAAIIAERAGVEIAPRA
jgi:3-hydroxyisobutyrate dehydrogenase-like beta-hydroxyacid dehydrogenase